MHCFESGAIFFMLIVVISYGEEVGDKIVLTDTNLIGPLELATPIYLYSKNLSQLYVSVHIAIDGYGIMG